jgi:hypothetical protein
LAASVCKATSLFREICTLTMYRSDAFHICPVTNTG